VAFDSRVAIFFEFAPAFLFYSSIYFFDTLNSLSFLLISSVSPCHFFRSLATLLQFTFPPADFFIDPTNSCILNSKFSIC